MKSDKHDLSCTCKNLSMTHMFESVWFDSPCVCTCVRARTCVCAAGQQDMRTLQNAIAQDANISCIPPPPGGCWV